MHMMFVGGPYGISHDRPAAPLQDLTEDNLFREAFDLLGVKHLSNADGTVPWPVKGILYGPCLRPLIALPTAIGNRTHKNVVYLVDTGAPITELSPKTFEALCAPESLSIPSAAYASINGTRQQVFLCDPSGNHADLPVLGADTMRAQHMKLCIDYEAGTVTLSAA
jgi:hypothetical protein